MTGDEFLDKAILVVVFVVLQVPLWAWVGLQARRVFPWWPF
jgi:hypothetical protein